MIQHGWPWNNSNERSWHKSPFTGDVQNRHICRGRCVVTCWGKWGTRWVGMCECYLGNEERFWNWLQWWMQTSEYTDTDLYAGAWVNCTAWIYHNTATKDEKKSDVLERARKRRVRDYFKPLSQWSMNRAALFCRWTTKSIRWGSKVSQIAQPQVLLSLVGSSTQNWKERRVS